ncbi:hypothetical protein [Halorubrum pallidum]
MSYRPYPDAVLRSTRHLISRILIIVIVFEIRNAIALFVEDTL